MSWSVVCWRFNLCIAIAVVFRPSIFGDVLAAENEKPAMIRVAIYADQGITKEALPEVRACLPAREGFEIETITAEKIRAARLVTSMYYIQPGGSAWQAR